MSARRLSAGAVGAVCGAVFGLGLWLSGMLDPGKVLGFLDVAGAWDPSLAFVMGGAVGVHFTWLRWIARPATTEPAAASVSQPPRGINARLLLGASIFGVGWGMAGYCPGPALVAAASGRREALLFVASMAAGIALFNSFSRRAEAPSSLQEPV